MKKASKIFVLISMVAVPLALIVYLVLGLTAINGANIALRDHLLSNEQIASYEAIILLCQVMIAFFVAATISSEVVGGFALHKLKTASRKSDLTGIGILTIILCSMVGGILMLCIPEEELNV
jgi:hypothetical protein